MSFFTRWASLLIQSSPGHPLFRLLCALRVAMCRPVMLCLSLSSAQALLPDAPRIESVTIKSTREFGCPYGTPRSTHRVTAWPRLTFREHFCPKLHRTAKSCTQTFFCGSTCRQTGKSSEKPAETTRARVPCRARSKTPLLHPGCVT